MKQYQELLKSILDTGEDRPDRTGTGVLSKFGVQMRFDLNDGFPIVTTKRVAFNLVKAELLWMIEGSGDDFRLKEILYGDRYDSRNTIWTANAQADYWTSRKLQRHVGDLGRIYGVQWRRWRKPLVRINKVVLQNHDQILELVNGLKNDPYSRRHILSAWNPGELDMMALPPCHMFAQFYVSNDKKLSCQMYQRSMDTPLGAPFNIASYSLLTHMLAQVCDLKVGEFIHTIGDAHIYKNQIDGVKEQLSREPLPLPTLWLNPEIKDLTKFTMDDIKLENYQHHPEIKFPFST
jgi:thymidylate synthase